MKFLVKRKSFLLAGIVSVVLIAMCGCGLDKSCIKEDEKKDAEQKDSIIEQAEKIETKYGINIMWGGRCDEQRMSEFSEDPDLTIDEEKIRFALCEIEAILERFPDRFFDEYKTYEAFCGEYKYVDIYLCEKFLQDDDIVDAIQFGYTNFYKKNSGAYICVDINQKNKFKRDLSHEFFHVIESKIGLVSVIKASDNNKIMDNIYTNWEKINPVDYCYLQFENNHGDIHVYDVDLPYDIDTEDIDNVYFVSKYAQVSDEEDRAETFSYLIACDDADELPKAYNSPHVKEKAKLLVEMIDDTFDCVDDDAYWARMYREKYGD